jgi:chromosome segregation ATPase
MIKRGFEDNVSRVRPRVRLGQPDSGLEDDGQEVAAPEPSAPAGVAGLPVPPARAEVLPSNPAAAVPRRSPSIQASRARNDALQVAQLAKDLGADLLRASEVNAKLRADLDAAVASLRQAAQEAKEQELEHDRLLREMDVRASAHARLQEDLQLLEGERDGAGAQVARLVRELREEKARGASALERAREAGEELQRIHVEMDRLAAESASHAAERDRALAEVASLEAERDSLAGELLAARQAVDEGAQSRDALEEIHRALDEARSRASLVQR